MPTEIVNPPAETGSNSAPAPAPAPAPASVPSTNKPPPPKPPVTTAKASPTADKLVDPFEALEKEWSQPEPKTADELKPATEPDAPGEGNKPEVKPAEKAVEPQRAVSKATRENFEKLSTEAREAKSKVAELETKLAEASTKAKDATVMAERIAAVEKEHEGTKAELRALKQEASPEFKEKWDKPFNQAAKFAKEEIEQLTAIGEDGEERAATYDDFVDLYHLPLGKAFQQAKAMFGDASEIVMRHRNNLLQLDRARGEALAQEKAQWAETERTQQAKAAQQREQAEAQRAQYREIYERVYKEIGEKHPDWFGVDPDDPEGNALLEESRKLVDAKPQTHQEAIILSATIRQRAAGFLRMAHRAKNLGAELEAAKATIEELRGSGPGGGKRGEVETGEKSFEQDMRESLAQ